MDHMADVTVTHSPEQERYVLTVDGEQAGYLDYVDEVDVRLLTHTVVDEPTGLLDDFLPRPGEVRSAKPRDRAEGTPAITARGHLEWGVWPRTQAASSCSWSGGRCQSGRKIRGGLSRIESRHGRT